MGSGKSFMGRQLAKALDWKFMDLDDFLEEKAGTSISQIFENQGQAFFRELENQCLKATFQYENCVIATGGGTPCFFDNIRLINQQGISIYLKTPTSILVKRLKNEMNHRPLIAGKSTEELCLFIKNKLQERNPYYLKSTVIFEYKTGSETAEDLIPLLK